MTSSAFYRKRHQGAGGLEGGFRESELSWTQLLLDLKNRGLAKGSKLAMGDGSLDFWKAWGKVTGKGIRGNTWWQRY